MKRIITGAIFGALCALALSTSGTIAQESTNRVAANTDWSVFVEDNPTECWSVSKPKETVNIKNGRAVVVSRGDILLFVSYRPKSNVNGQVSFTGGYPFAKGSAVSLTVGRNAYQMFTDGEWAWAAPADDAMIVSAMKRGASAIIQAQSSRGTKTKDTFSLLGFTAAVDEAGKRCGG